MFSAKKITSEQQKERLLIVLTVTVFMFLFFFAVAGGFRLGYGKGQANSQNGAGNSLPTFESVAMMNMSQINVIDTATFKGVNGSDGREYTVHVLPGAEIYVVDSSKNQDKAEVHSGAISDINASSIVNVRSNDKNPNSTEINSSYLVIYKQ